MVQQYWIVLRKSRPYMYRYIWKSFKAIRSDPNYLYKLRAHVHLPPNLICTLENNDENKYKVEIHLEDIRILSSEIQFKKIKSFGRVDRKKHPRKILFSAIRIALERLDWNPWKWKDSFKVCYYFCLEDILVMFIVVKGCFKK